MSQDTLARLHQTYLLYSGKHFAEMAAVAKNQRARPSHFRRHAPLTRATFEGLHDENRRSIRPYARHTNNAPAVRTSMKHSKQPLRSSTTAASTKG